MALRHLYLHGFASGPRSTKGVRFAEHFAARGLDEHVNVAAHEQRGRLPVVALDPHDAGTGFSVGKRNGNVLLMRPVTGVVSHRDLPSGFRRDQVDVARWDSGNGIEHPDAAAGGLAAVNYAGYISGALVTAWMDDVRGRWKRPDTNQTQTPVAHLVCNYAAGVGGKPAAKAPAKAKA